MVPGNTIFGLRTFLFASESADDASQFLILNFAFNDESLKLFR